MKQLFNISQIRKKFLDLMTRYVVCVSGETGESSRKKGSNIMTLTRPLSYT